MRVWLDTDKYIFYIHSYETRKTMHINATGAKKVARCCNVEIEKFTTLQLTAEKEKYKVKGTR